MVLGYINSDAKRFKIFVANRVQLIREHSEPSQWTYIESKNNPADETSRGLSPSNLEKIERWVKGTEFLWEEESRWPQSKEKEVNDISDDPEAKKTVAVNVSKIEEDIVSILQIRLSSYKKMLRVVTWVIKFTKIIRGKLNKTPQIEMLLAEDLKEAEIVILKLYQKLEFKDTYKILSEVKTSEGCQLENRLGCLNPFMDENGLIRVGSRLRKSSLEFGAVHPVLLSKTGNATKMIVS